MRRRLVLLLVAFPLAGIVADEGFEKHIRPLLIDRCVKCHGPAKQSGGLRLDSKEAFLQGGEKGPAAISGKPDESLLLKAVLHQGELRMPPKEKLTEGEITHLRDWIKRGMPWLVSKDTPVATNITSEHRKWWAYQPLRTGPLPIVSNQAWSHSEIDRFILAGLEARHLAPSSPADKRTLLRRVTFDMIGLPPTPAEVEAFLKDNRPDAFAHVVDHLLQSPQYGQRWARQWLDVVRYADYHAGDPNGRNPVCEPLEAWRYRDWVVQSFNRDMPFDRFIEHQIAGDLQPAADGKEPNVDGLIATTFLVNGAWDRGDADKEKMVSDMVDDQIDTVGKAFMGLTLGCARCHDHKFDPVAQTDYYALAGIFYSTRMLTELGTKGGEITLQRRPLVPQAVADKHTKLTKQITGLTTILAEMDKKNPKTPNDDPTRELLTDMRERLKKELPPEPPLALAVSEGGVPGGLFPKIQDVPLHIRGSYTRLGPVVPRAMPKFFVGDNQPKIANGSGRKELASWITSKDNPLTARVIVNRIWHWHFGIGLVATPNNFGMLSSPPSHPELLDWLTTKFIEEGWSLKKLHRRILLSAAYQQSSHASPEVVARDPENRWLGRFTPRRLDAEAMRDAMLTINGRLDLASDGPATNDLNTSRRSLYVQTARWDRSNYATLFDAANPDASVEGRQVSTVAPQALFLMNHDFVLKQAKLLAERVTRDEPNDVEARIHRLFQLAYQRRATAADIKIARQLLDKSRSKEQATAWLDLAHTVLCSNEFVYLD